MITGLGGSTIWTSDINNLLPFYRDVVGSWLSLLTMSPSRYSHRGLAPHKFAPMLGAHPSFQRTAFGSR